MRGLTLPAWLPLPVTLPLQANHLAREGQVGEGVSPDSQCQVVVCGVEIEVSRTFEPQHTLGSAMDHRVIRPVQSH
jgi:hypothetical protein